MLKQTFKFFKNFETKNKFSCTNVYYFFFNFLWQFSEKIKSWIQIRIRVTISVFFLQNCPTGTFDECWKKLQSFLKPTLKKTLKIEQKFL